MSTPDAVLCCKDDSGRREMARQVPLNGFDYLEVSEDQRSLTVYFLGKAPQWRITPQHLRIDGGERVRGIRITRVDVKRSDREELDDCMMVGVDQPGDFSPYTLCIVELDDHGQPTTEPPVDFDPRYARLSFSFKAGCPGDLDCVPADLCAEEPLSEPAINYLAKDYASFRRLILDRLSLVMPDWGERHVPDVGITLVELLAYAGDQLSYYQDAVATEAYLDTARQRISVRRHARLVDYLLHEGCNARAWLTVQVSQDLKVRARDVYFVTAVADTSARVLRDEVLRNESRTSYLVFEPLQPGRDADLDLHEAHNEIRIYTWGATECCVPKGATRITLVDPGVWPTPPEQPSEPCSDNDGEIDTPEPGRRGPEGPDPTMYRLQLNPCDVLIFEEAKGPSTANPADADPNHRHAVRLTKVTPTQDPLTRTLLMEVEWCEEDALPFPLCLSSVGSPPECAPISDVSVAHGNVILVDHGESTESDLGQVPVRTIVGHCEDACTPSEIRRVPGRYRPRLPRPDVTFATPVHECRLVDESCGGSCGSTAASRVIRQESRAALPQISLRSIGPAPNGEPGFHQSDVYDPTVLATAMASSGDDLSTPAAWLRRQLEPALATMLSDWAAQQPLPPLPQSLRDHLQRWLLSLTRDWTPHSDLLASDPDDRHFVVEVDDERGAHVRFGDGDNGQILTAGASFHAYYRIGNGPAGNVGADSVTRIVFRNNFPSGLTIAVRNPMPACGGVAPESVAEAKLRAPHAFRTRLERAITPADYAAIVMRDFSVVVQRAAAEFRWDGMQAQVMVAVDPVGRADPDAELLCRIERHLERYRRIGHDVNVVAARQVPLDLAVTVCVKRGYLRGHIKAAALDALSNRVLRDGRRGYFHPDNLSFGEGIFLSEIVSRVQALEGVESVVVTRLERLYDGPNGELQAGVLPLGAMEVARLDNDPNFPDRGQLALNVEGGR